MGVGKGNHGNHATGKAWHSPAREEVLEATRKDARKIKERKESLARYLEETYPDDEEQKMQRAKVKFMMVPTIIVQVGATEHPDDVGPFIAEEEYRFTKSGFTGHINRIHEDGPGDSSEMDHVDFDSLEKALRAAFKEGAPNMTAAQRVKLLELFKQRCSSDISHQLDFNEEWD